jgi:hypothetical protein
MFRQRSLVAKLVAKAETASHCKPLKPVIASDVATVQRPQVGYLAAAEQGV